jgi:hypothetical protein
MNKIKKIFIREIFDFWHSVLKNKFFKQRINLSCYFPKYNYFLYPLNLGRGMF